MVSRLTQSMVSISPKSRDRGYSPAPNSCSCLGRHQFCHSQQIVRSSYKPGRQLRAMHSLESSLPESADYFYPSKDLLYLLPESLAQTIPHMPCRSTINRRSPFALHILSHMRRDLPAAQHAYKPSFVVPLIAPEGFGLNPFPRLPLEHRLGGLGFRRPRRRRATENHP